MYLASWFSKYLLVCFLMILYWHLYESAESPGGQWHPCSYQSSCGQQNQSSDFPPCTQHWQGHTPSTVSTSGLPLQQGYGGAGVRPEKDNRNVRRAGAQILYWSRGCLAWWSGGSGETLSLSTSSYKEAVTRWSWSLKGNFYGHKQ